MRDRRWFPWVAALGLCSTALLAQVPAPPPPPPPAGLLSQARPSNAQVASELLDRLQRVFDQMGSVEEGELAAELSNLARDGRACLESAIFDKNFHARYARLLRVVRLVLITDTGDILADIVNRELVAFVRDVTGKAYDPSAGASEQIVMFSDAVATELTQLHALAKKLR